jgi:hypothetical protein
MNHIVNGGSLYKSLGGAAIGAAAGGIGGHLLDRAAHRQYTGLLQNQISHEEAAAPNRRWVDEMNSQDNLDRFNAGMEAHAKKLGKGLHELTGDDFNAATNAVLADPHFAAIQKRYYGTPAAQVATAAPKTASGELGPLREFLHLKRT